MPVTPTLLSPLTPPATVADRPPRHLLGWAALAGRLLLAAVLGYAALTKIGDPAATVRAVRAYELLPEAIAVPFGHALPAIELALAALLLLGVAVRLSAAATAVLMGMFFVGVASAAARGLKIDCGCFGGGGPTDDPKYAVELLRDAALTAIAIGVALIGRSRLALDPQRPAPVGAEPAPDCSGAERRRHRTAVARQLAVQERVGRRLKAHAWIAVVSVVVAGLLGIATAAGSAQGSTLRIPAGVTEAGGIVVGAVGAPHRVVLFEDPQCPACGQFEKVSGAALTKAIGEGKVSVEYRMRSFLGPESVRAVSALGAAADEGRFEPLREAIFTHQPQEHSGGYTVDELLELGAGVGLTSERFREAVSTQVYAPWARSVDDRASRDGNVGTPELRLDGRKVDSELTFDPARLVALFG